MKCTNRSLVNEEIDNWLLHWIVLILVLSVKFKTEASEIQNLTLQFQFLRSKRRGLKMFLCF